ncbi:MAG: hypothetical protein U1F27_05335 [Turneriella sp.]
MIRAILQLFTLALFVSCTAINQQNAYLDSLPRPSNVVFSEDFENGLANWSQLAGTWTTGAPGANGVALISPTGTSASAYTISTANNIDLTNRSNCRLQYDVRYSFSANPGIGSGAYGQILFAGNLIGEFKNIWGSSSLSSSGQFLTRTVQLSAGTSGKLTIIIFVPTSTTADVRIDNVSVSCNYPSTAAYSVVLDNFEGGTANWTLNANWTLTAAVGVGGSNAIKATNTAANSPMIATYQPNINLQGRMGCTLSYYYSQVGSSQTANSIDLYFGGQNVRKDLASVASANVTQFLTVFEGSPTNSMYFACNIPANNGQTAPCTIDNIILNCQQ